MLPIKACLAFQSRSRHERAARHRNRLLPAMPGVWLDRGELDKIIERSMAEQPAYQEPSSTLGMFGDKHGRSGKHGGATRAVTAADMAGARASCATCSTNQQ
jgi:hypothetical protein